MITYEVNRAELELVEKKLGDMKSKAPQVFKNAVNKTARQAKETASRRVQKEPIPSSRSDSIVT